MRLGKNEKKILLAILNTKSDFMDSTPFTFTKNPQARVELAKAMWGNWFVRNERGKFVWDNSKAVKLTNSLNSLRDKGLITDRIQPKLTDKGKEIAQSIQTEIESYVAEWLHFTSKVYRKNILSLTRHRESELEKIL